MKVFLNSFHNKDKGGFFYVQKNTAKAEISFADKNNELKSVGNDSYIFVCDLFNPENVDIDNVYDGSCYYYAFGKDAILESSILNGVLFDDKHEVEKISENEFNIVYTTSNPGVHFYQVFNKSDAGKMIGVDILDNNNIDLNLHSSGSFNDESDANVPKNGKFMICTPLASSEELVKENKELESANQSLYPGYDLSAMKISLIPSDADNLITLKVYNIDDPDIYRIYHISIKNE